MKSIEILSHGLVGTDRGSRSPVTFTFLILSIWKMRHVFVYCMTSSLKLAKSSSYSVRRMFSSILGGQPIECHDARVVISSSGLHL